jgi:hypothetical protein
MNTQTTNFATLKTQINFRRRKIQRVKGDALIGDDQDQAIILKFNPGGDFMNLLIGIAVHNHVAEKFIDDRL